jgi:hypothetical protein
MTENSFKINDEEFQLTKLSAMKQFHVARKVAPILADLLPAMAGIQKINDKKPESQLTESEKLEEFARVLGPVVEGLSKLSDKDSEYVLNSLLSSAEVKQKQFGSWAKVATEHGLQIQNLDLPILLQVAGRAFVFNLAGFFNVLPKLS